MERWASNHDRLLHAKRVGIDKTVCGKRTEREASEWEKSNQEDCPKCFRAVPDPKRD